MKKTFSRAQRIGHQLQKEIAVILQSELRDPRIGMITISRVDVSPNLAYAKVFFTVMNAENKSGEHVKHALASFKASAGFIRMQLGKTLRLRYVPALVFHYDDSLLQGIHINKLLKDINDKDILMLDKHEQ